MCLRTILNMSLIGEVQLLVESCCLTRTCSIYRERKGFPLHAGSTIAKARFVRKGFFFISVKYRQAA